MYKRQMYDSIKQAARRSHIQVTTIQTARTQADQIDAIRTLLVYRTNAIIFSPVMENGWEYILSEAAEAEIPLITINERPRYRAPPRRLPCRRAGRAGTRRCRSGTALPQMCIRDRSYPACYK